MKQFPIIFGYELKNFFKNKVFIGTTVFLTIVIAIVMFIPAISSAVSSDDPGVAEDRPIMLVSAENDLLADFIDETFSAAFTDYEVKLTKMSAEDIKENIREGNENVKFLGL